MIIVVPSCRKNNGTGHLKRCIALVLRYPSGACLALPKQDTAEAYGMDSLGGVFPELAGLPLLKLDPEGLPDPSDYSCFTGGTNPTVVLDLRVTKRKVFDRWLALTPHLVGLDEGGPCRRLFPWLVDALGVSGGGVRPNARVLPVKIPEITERGVPDPGRILISFGGEDPTDLTDMALCALIKAGVSPDRVKVVLGPLYRGKAERWQNISFIRGAVSLERFMRPEMILLTAYGLTAWEGRVRGLAVYLLNPSPVHRKLGLDNGFLTDPSIRGLSPGMLNRVLRGDAKEKAYPHPDHFPAGKQMSDLLHFLKPLAGACPCCGKSGGKTAPLYRKESGSFYRCPGSGLIYFRLLTNKGQSRYNADYFFQQYRDQYGKTYLEDFEAIRRVGERRMAVITNLRGEQKGNLLDIGCAYGPFLVAAQKAGYFPFGTDISKDAVSHVRDQLGFTAWTGVFPADMPGVPTSDTGWDVVTLWFVLEHFPDLRDVLETIYGALATNGLLAFSTPNGRGISSRRNFHRFLDSSPDDHYFIMDPRSAIKVLRKHRFRVKKTVVTGHHPERFFPGLDLSVHPWLEKALVVISQWFRLGDTFEIYAEKRG